LADDGLRARIAAELDAERAADAWEGVMIGGTVDPALLKWRGLTIASMAQITGRTAGTVIVDLLRQDDLRTGAFFFGMSEANLRRIYAQPWVMVGSDASIRALQGPLSADHPHPRAYGTFPRFLRMVQDEGVLTMPESIRRITSLPADAFGLRGRGRIAPAAMADLVLFDPAGIRDLATYAKPHVFSRGVRQVWVNGCCCYAQGQVTGRRAGRLLQSQF
jgi:N-acyl-D-amino-acid deacylase